jgi:hypothetical protein
MNHLHHGLDRNLLGQMLAHTCATHNLADWSNWYPTPKNNRRVLVGQWIFYHSKISHLYQYYLNLNHPHLAVDDGRYIWHEYEMRIDCIRHMSNIDWGYVAILVEIYAVYALYFLLSHCDHHQMSIQALCNLESGPWTTYLAWRRSVVVGQISTWLLRCEIPTIDHVFCCTWEMVVATARSSHQTSYTSLLSIFIFLYNKLLF